MLRGVQPFGSTMAALLLIGYTPSLVFNSIMSLMNYIVSFCITWEPFFYKQKLLSKDSDICSVIISFKFKFQFLIVIDKYEIKHIGSRKNVR